MNKRGYQGDFPTLPYKTEKYAVEFAYAKNTMLKEYSYAHGKPKASYKEALNKVFRHRASWGRKSRKGASCDVFVGTVLRKAGYKKAPRGLVKFPRFLKAHLAKRHEPKAGYICLKGNHIGVCVSLKGKKYIANAHHNKHGGTYGIIESLGNYDSYWKPEGRTSFTKGDKFTDVRKLKKFLNWYGDYGLDTESYVFGEKTELAVKNFQNKEGLKVNGHFGEKSLAKAKEVVKR